MKNVKELYNKISEDILREELEKFFKEIVCTNNTGYTQNLILNENGELELHRLGQNESLQREFNGEAFTLLSQQEFNVLDIDGYGTQEEGEEGEMVDAYIDNEFSDWCDSTIREIEDNVRRCD